MRLRRYLSLLRDPSCWLEHLVLQLLRALTWGRSPDDALRALFRVDAVLYNLQGQLAVRYGHGVHPKHRHTRYHDFFVERIAPGQRVLDVGCGNGALSKDIGERSDARVLGMDIVPANIEAARARHAHGNVNYVLGDVLTDLPRESMDVVVLSNVLEHLPERPAFLRRLAGLTGARLFLIRVPLFERDWRVPLRKELGEEWRLDSTHETEHTLESFAAEMDAAGMEVTEQQVRWGEIWAAARPRSA